MARISTFDWLHEVSGSFETGVGAMVGFGGEAHGCSVRTASISFFVVAGESQLPRA